MGKLWKCCCDSSCNESCDDVDPIESLTIDTPENGQVSVDFSDRQEFECSISSTRNCINGDWTVLSDKTCMSEWPTSEPVYSQGPNTCFCYTPQSFKTWGFQAQKAMRVKVWAIPRWVWYSNIGPVGSSGLVNIEVVLEVTPFVAFGSSGGARIRAKSKNYDCVFNGGWYGVQTGTSSWYEPDPIVPLPEPKRCFLNGPTDFGNIPTACNPITLDPATPQNPPDSTSQVVGTFLGNNCTTGEISVFRTICNWGCTDPASFCGFNMIGFPSAFVNLYGGSGQFGFARYRWLANVDCHDLRSGPLILNRLGGATTYVVSADSLAITCEFPLETTYDSFEDTITLQIPAELEVNLT
jgi:hypothetical protein